MQKAAFSGIISVLGLLWTCASPVGAQEAAQKWDYRAELFGSAGHGRFYHGDNFWGGGAEFGLGIGVRPFPGSFHGIGLEFQFLHSNHLVQPSSTHSYRGGETSFALNGVYHFSSSRIQPFVCGGVGVMKADFTLRGLSEWFDDQGHHLETTSQQVDASKFLVDVGAGIKVRLGRGFYVRPEIRTLTTTPGSGWNFGYLGLSVGLGYTF